MDMHVDQKLQVMISSLDQKSGTPRDISCKLYELEEYEGDAKTISLLEKMYGGDSNDFMEAQEKLEGLPVANTKKEALELLSTVQCHHQASRQQRMEIGLLLHGSLFWTIESKITDVFSSGQSIRSEQGKPMMERMCCLF